VPFTYDIRCRRAFRRLASGGYRNFYANIPSIRPAALFTSQSVAAKGSPNVIWNAFWKPQREKR